MLAEESQPHRETRATIPHPGKYSPVIVDMNGNSLGAIFLGILSFLLLLGWMRTEDHYHKLLKQLTQHEKVSGRS